MPEKRNVWLPVLLMIVFAITRWPNLMPPNFSAAYALVFCAGVYFRNRVGWWVPLVIMLATDVALNFFYYRPRGWNGFQLYQLMNYAAYAVIFFLGRRFKPSANFLSMVGGGLLSAVLFYLITNTAAWFFNPFNNQEYGHNWDSWLLAMTLGTGSWPDTWQFFRNTLLSSGLFTALFAAAMKSSQYLESAAEKKAAEATEETEDTDKEPQPDEA
ncbi:MAG TPA: DUF6580 family putative transport protein [Candidatus Limnocylindria bacterium]|nr:DUF6580 family putative transport protein [Candidatus Limnocylindria bacterium]